MLSLNHQLSQDNGCNIKSGNIEMSHWITASRRKLDRAAPSESFEGAHPGWVCSPFGVLHYVLGIDSTAEARGRTCCNLCQTLWPKPLSHQCQWGHCRARGEILSSCRVREVAFSRAALALSHVWMVRVKQVERHAHLSRNDGDNVAMGQAFISVTHDVSALLPEDYTSYAA